MVEPQLESFSSGYSIVHNATVRTWNDEEAHMDVDLYEGIIKCIKKPVVGFIDGCHYMFKPSTQVLSGQCAIPRDNRGSDPSVLMIRK